MLHWSNTTLPRVSMSTNLVIVCLHNSMNCPGQVGSKQNVTTNDLLSIALMSLTLEMTRLPNMHREAGILVSSSLNTCQSSEHHSYLLDIVKSSNKGNCIISFMEYYISESHMSSIWEHLLELYLVNLNPCSVICMLWIQCTGFLKLSCMSTDSIQVLSSPMAIP